MKSNIFRFLRVKLAFRSFCTSVKKINEPELIRNISILAHIDAGKTTTTERMLFYAGKTKTLGEVHHGTTVTDYLPQERERGITICSAAVSFNWKEHRINCIDTPGHIDFTMEVEQSLGAVDGCVVILDSSSGVQAQTFTIWRQSNNYDLPKIVFCNKMDRPDADFNKCIKDVEIKLNSLPIALQLPIHEKGIFKGIIDLLSMKKITWDSKHLGQSYEISDILNEELYKNAKENRLEMIDKLSNFDDQLADAIIANESLDNVDINLILNAIRRLTIQRKCIPVLAGSAYKNIGVQLLIDSIINYLPAPNERNKIYSCFGKDFVGRVFKVTHDKQRGPLSLVRIYGGELKRGTRVMTSSGASENIQRIYEPLADEYKETDVVSAGNVCVCAGLKNTKTGDILISNMTSLRNAQKKLKATNNNVQVDESEGDFSLFNFEPKIPPAVYFCSIEPPSASYQSALETALSQIQREDPSLRVSFDETTMQTVLGGMGELHLEIIKSRLLTEYKIDADLGPLQIAYKETIEDACRESLKIEKEIAGAKQSVEIDMTLDVLRSGDEVFRIDHSPNASDSLKSVRPKFIHLVKRAAISALERGPKIGGEVVNVKIILHSLIIGRNTAESVIAAAASQCIQKILLSANCRLMEPMMSVQIVAPTEKVSPILSDLGRRRAQIGEISLQGEHNKIIEFVAPLAELQSYSSIVRTISSGTANLLMQPHGYELLSSVDEQVAIRRAQGFE
ncbi:hypothetical protein PVAND_000712 [Polypedilum vanderplanki]|uniref:Elongation factor G2 n=1 Tax=Polypedilum vanderplanki TaxID=319348 RepID=A0A9J6BL61_POLVA|nr:hypothetical protein PVAND_000712 [Polypedilum vanderplanki]